MVTQVLLWSALVPGAASVVLLLPWLLLRWRPAVDGPSPRRAWAGGLAVGLGLIAGGVGQVGLGSGPNHRVLYVALGAMLVGLLVDETRWRGVLLWTLRVLAGVAVGLVLILPLARAQTWSNLDVAWRVAAVAAAALPGWAVLGALARREQGAGAAVGMLAWTLSAAAGLVLSASASGGLLAGALAAALGAAVIVLLLAPATEGRLCAAVPVVSLTLTGLLAAGKLYASMPWSSFALLAVAPLGLLVAWLPGPRGWRPLVAVPLRTALVVLVAGAGLGLAARDYFAPHAPATGGEGGSYAPYGDHGGYAPYGQSADTDNGSDDEGYGGYEKYRRAAPADAGSPAE